MFSKGAVAFRFRHRSIGIVTRSDSTVASIAEAQSENSEWASAKPYSAIPGPKPLPIPKFGNFWRMLPGIGTYRNLPLINFYGQLQKDFGPIVKLAGMGKSDKIFVYDPKDVQTVFQTETKWPSRNAIEFFDYYRRVTRKDIFEGNIGLSSTDGEEWHRNRIAFNQTLMKPINVMRYQQPIQLITNEFVERVKSLRDKNLELPEDFENELNKWALESIACVALDARLGCLDGALEPDSEAQILINAVDQMFYLMYKLEMRPSLWRYYSTRDWKKFVNSMDTIVNTCIKHINKKLDAIKNRPEGSAEVKSVLESFLVNGGPGMAKTMAIEMITAGIDTTSNTTAIAMYYLSKNEEVQEKLFAELKEVLPKKDDELEPDYLNCLPYLKACVKESQRLTPIVSSNSRSAGKDLVLKGYKIPKGTKIVMVNAVMCRSEENYPRAMEFIPERWLRTADNDISHKNTHPYVFLPFGFGPRMCIGRRFAELKMHTILTKLFRNFKISYNYGEMEWKSQLFITPNKPLKFKMEDRP